MGGSIVPDAYRELVECPPVAALTTVMASGYPQTSVVWCDYDGEYVRVNTMRGFAKERNMRRNPLVTLLCYDSVTRTRDARCADPGCPGCAGPVGPREDARAARA